MSVRPYIYFRGSCREAIEFYADAFKTKEPKIVTFGDIPQGGKEMPNEQKKLILHAALTIAGDTVMFSDASPERPLTVGNNVSIITELDTVDMVVAVFNKLKVGGEIIMDVQETFFSKCYAYLIDKFGVSWQLNVKSA